MNPPVLPWLELTLLVPLAGAGVAALLRPAAVAGRFCLAVLLVTLGLAVRSAAAVLSGGMSGPRTFAVDDLSAPLLPVLALLHLMTMLGTAKSRVSPPFCARLLLAAGINLAAVTCHSGWVLTVLMSLAVLLPYWDLRSRSRGTRGYALHMALFVFLLVAGWYCVSTGSTRLGPWGYGLLLIALLLRGGILPFHGWMPTLFEGAAFGTAILFVLPLVEVLAALRLLLPSTPDWMLNLAAVACLVTAVYGGGMAIVQNEVRRFFAHLCVSQTSLVMFAVMLHTSNGLTAALCLWISSSLALAGLAFSVRALEARFGSLSLAENHGYYEQVPGIAICFLMTGLASVGFPGTIGFVPVELLISGSADQGLWVSFTLALAAMFNGIAILRAYFALFTGKRRTPSVSLRITPVERAAIILIALVVFLGGWFSPDVVASRHHAADRLLQRVATP